MGWRFVEFYLIREFKDWFIIFQGELQNASYPINNLINTKGRQLVEAFKAEVQAIAMKQIQRIFKGPLSNIKFDDLLQYMKDIVDNTLLNKIKRSNSEENFNNSTSIQEGLDVSTITVVGLSDTTVIAVKDSLNRTVTNVKDTSRNTTDFRKILNNSLRILRPQLI